MLPYEPPSPQRPDAIRATDRYAIDVLGIPGLLLMEHAARNITEWLLHNTTPGQRARVVLLCGPGNNGGDALAVARLLQMCGVTGTCLLSAPPERYREDAGTNLQIATRLGLPLVDHDDPQATACIRGATLLIDGLLGTGSAGAPRGVMTAWISTANENADARRIAIDLPSGLDADTGAAHAPTFVADTTLTLLAAKSGFASTMAGDVLGQVVVLGIGLSPDLTVGKFPPDSG